MIIFFHFLSNNLSDDASRNDKWVPIGSFGVQGRSGMGLEPCGRGQGRGEGRGLGGAPVAAAVSPSSQVESGV